MSKLQIRCWIVALKMLRILLLRDMLPSQRLADAEMEIAQTLHVLKSEAERQ